MTDFKHNLKTTRPQSGRRLNLRTVNFCLAFVLILMGFSYVVCVNDLTVKGFALEELKRQAKSLAEDNQEVQDKIVAIQSYLNLANQVKELNMVAVGSVDYLSANNQVVARQ